MSEVTCILTSCNRFDLLRRTLESFMVHNTYDIKEFIVYNDGGIEPVEFHTDFPFIRWVSCGTRKGQIHALDTLWDQVKTPYAFTMEDDWEFLRPGFIEASMEILERNPYVLQVWLQQPEPTNQHPIQWNGKYGVMKSGPGLWAGLRFNPSLRRKSDYDLIAPFSKHTTFNPAKGWKSEAAISKVYNDMGFKAAILPGNYIKHIGENRRVK